jgi:putative transposase
VKFCSKEGAEHEEKSIQRGTDHWDIARSGGRAPVKAVCAAHNISMATYHASKRKFGGMEVSEAERLRALEEENSRLKRLVADQAVQIHILKEVNAKKW